MVLRFKLGFDIWMEFLRVGVEFYRKDNGLLSKVGNVVYS